MSNPIKMIDPLGPLGLTAKYKKALEKGKIEAIRLEFTPEGVRAVALKKGGVRTTEADWLPLADALAASKTEVVSSLEDERSYWANKYEVRLDEEAPASIRNAASEEALKAAVAAIPFKKRRALQMSNKEFELAFLRWEDGRPVVRSAEQAEELRIAQIKPKASGGKPNAPVQKGQGPKGKGKGSFRETPGEPAESSKSSEKAS